jgi:hypothetical protein
MANFAVLDGTNVVENIIVAETQEIAEDVTKAICIEYTDENPAEIGWIYDSETGKFSPPGNA